jgi:hypothetical protein
MFEGADVGFCGPAYEAPMLLQDAERCINYFLEVDKNPRAKMPYALLSAPGLNPIISTITGAVRGAWVLPGNLTALFVVGTACYLATVTTPATQTSIAQFSITQVGTLLTNAGRVVIRDNGVLFNGFGGYAVLVDGFYGYFYRIAGAGSVTFTGNLTINTPTISFPVGVILPYYLIVSSGTITDSGGLLPTNTLISSISFTANTITLSQNASNTATGDTFTLNIPQFGQILDPAFLGADRIAFIEGWLLFNQPGTRTFYTNAPVPYTLTFAGAFYSLKDSSTDNLITLMENNREAWLVGERTSEVWFNSGGTNFAFSRLPGVGPQMGCSAKHSITRVGPNLCWLAQNEQGQNIVVMTNQYAVIPISNHAIENAISSYPLVSDAIGDCYEDRGHIIYVLTFPTADVTWCFDLKVWSDTDGQAGWWQRLSWDPNAGVYHRHRGNCFVNFANLRLWGDYQTGQIHQQDRTFYTDAGNPLRAQRRTPHIWSREDRNRVFQSSLQVEFKAGTGLQTGQGSSPQAMIRWSDDGGQTWGNEVWAPIGAAGETRDRAMVFQIGEARDRVYEVNVSDPVSRDIVGATLFGERQEKNG